MNARIADPLDTEGSNYWRGCSPAAKYDGNQDGVIERKALTAWAKYSAEGVKDEL